jgi:PhoPQ-activated pathogenicity-related protein
MFSKLKKHRVVLIFFVVALAAAAWSTRSGDPMDVPLTRVATRPTALDAYIAKPDPSYRYELVNTQSGEGATAFLVKMISQTWLTEAEVDRPVWEHSLYIYRPDELKHRTGFLFITGGANDGKQPRVSRDFLNIAKATNSVVAELRMVPNQPLVFKGDDFGPRKEDEILALGWRRYVETRDPKWIFRLPMTKAAVRAMDTVTSLLASEAGGGNTVDKFVVAGGSKRGWTTWTTAAVDKRVVAAVPIVIDLLNVERSFFYHFRKYGFWAPAVGDYFREGIMDRMDDPAFRELMAIVDPYAYRDRLTMPKFLVNGSGDQFFRPESSRFYYKDLRGEKHLRYVPNAGHDVGKGTDALPTIIAYYQTVLEGVSRPTMDWTVQADGSLRVTASSKPEAVRLWAATNPRFNDFRIDSAGPIYKSTPLEATEPNVWIANVPKPDTGFTAYFVEMEWKGPGRYPLKFSTEVLVNPETFPSGPPEPGKTRIGPKAQ